MLGAEARIDDLSRNVFGLLGIPIDAIDFSTLLHLHSMEAAAASELHCRFLISTPNVNFLVKSQRNGEFRRVHVAKRSVFGRRNAADLDCQAS